MNHWIVCEAKMNHWLLCEERTGATLAAQWISVRIMSYVENKREGKILYLIVVFKQVQVALIRFY